jgi:hypothetical protein
MQRVQRILVSHHGSSPNENTCNPVSSTGSRKSFCLRTSSSYPNDVLVFSLGPRVRGSAPSSNAPSRILFPAVARERFIFSAYLLHQLLGQRRRTINVGLGSRLSSFRGVFLQPWGKKSCGRRYIRPFRRFEIKAGRCCNDVARSGYNECATYMFWLQSLGRRTFFLRSTAGRRWLGQDSLRASAE